MSLAEALRRSNPDRALTNGGGDFVDEEFLPPEGAPTAEGAENGVEGARAYRRQHSHRHHSHQNLSHPSRQEAGKNIIQQ